MFADLLHVYNATDVFSRAIIIIGFLLVIVLLIPAWMGWRVRNQETLTAQQAAATHFRLLVYSKHIRDIRVIFWASLHTIFLLLAGDILLRWS